MVKSRAAFVVYGVHKDGLLDPDGTPFIDEKVIENSKKALLAKDIELAVEPLIIATKEEAKKVIIPLASDDSIDTLVLFSGTWVWAAHMIGAIREFAKSGKGIVIWTHDGSQGWRPVGGLVLSAALNEVGRIKYRFHGRYSLMDLQAAGSVIAVDSFFVFVARGDAVLGRGFGEDGHSLQDQITVHFRHCLLGHKETEHPYPFGT